MTEITNRTCIRSFVDLDEINFLKRSVNQQEKLEKFTEFYFMLSNPTRMRILYCLSQTRELCVCDLSDILEMEVSAISHQLRRLKDRGLVRNRRDGLTIYYSLLSNPIGVEACSFIDDVLSTVQIIP